MLPSLLAALVAVESGGNAAAVGDHGQALGLLQIHAGVVLDVNKFAGTHYVHADAFNPAAARRICSLYLEHYVTTARLGHYPTVQDYARVWNGGPQGWRRSATLGYWSRVKGKLTQENSRSIFLEDIFRYENQINTNRA